jgi:hypothetical protein
MDGILETQNSEKLKFIQTLQKVYQIKKIDDDFWYCDDYKFIYDSYDSYKSFNKEINKYSSEVLQIILQNESEGEKFWTSFFKSFLSEDFIEKMQLLKISADLSNPLACDLYAQILYEQNFEKASKKYFKIGSDLGNYKCTLSLITFIIDRTILKYFEKLDEDKRIKKIEKFLKFAERLEKFNQDSDTHQSLYKIFQVAYEYDYPIEEGEISYEYKSHLYKMMLGENEDTDISIDICEKYFELHNKFKEIKKLQSMSFEDVCKNIVMEYL